MFVGFVMRSTPIDSIEFNSTENPQSFGWKYYSSNCIAVSYEQPYKVVVQDVLELLSELRVQGVVKRCDK